MYNFCLQETHLNDNDNIKDIFKDYKGKVYLNSCNVGRKWPFYLEKG